MRIGQTPISLLFLLDTALLILLILLTLTGNQWNYVHVRDAPYRKAPMKLHIAPDGDLVQRKLILGSLLPLKEHKMPFITLKERGIFGTIFAVLVVTWLLSILASLTLGGTIHVLLALAFAMFVIALIRREWPRQFPSSARDSPR